MAEALPAESLPLAQCLREATRSAHLALDHHPLLAPLVRPALRLETYAHALAAIYGAHSGLEQLLRTFAPPDSFPFRSPELASDLAELGAAPYPVTVAPPCAQTPAERIGVMYVLEGSYLGGAVIAKHLARSLPRTAPRCFFTGAEAPPRWQLFWRFAHSICAHGGAAAALAARASFEFYLAHLDRCQGHRHAPIPDLATGETSIVPSFVLG